MDKKSQAPRSSKVTAPRKRFTSVATKTSNSNLPGTKNVSKGPTNSKLSTSAPPGSYSLKRTFSKPDGPTFECVNTSGTGTFGVVYKAVNSSNGEIVAIKRVLQDMRYKNRELEIMTELQHHNVVKMIDNFYEETKEGIYLNLVMEFIPKDLSTLYQSPTVKPTPSISLVRLYAYQLLRSLGYIHSLGIAHRDIKPQNLLVSPVTHVLKICDFGSAKRLVQGEHNIAYICSRFYRAPELLFGAIHYTTAIDVWSAGCVIAELLLGKPLFPGKNNVDQLFEIIKVLGTPTKTQISAMNPSFNKNQNFSSIPTKSWSKVFPSSVPSSALDLLNKMMVYSPSERIDPFEALAHPFFDKLRTNKAQALYEKGIPDLFNFTEAEVKRAKELGILQKLTEIKQI